MSKCDNGEIIKNTYKRELTDIKEVEYYESLKISNNLVQKESVEETKDDNIVTDDTNSLKYILNNLTSIIAVIAAFYAVFSRFTNAMFAYYAEDFYNVPADLFYYNRNFEFIVSILIYFISVLVLFSPLYLKDKWRNKKIEKVEALLLSAIISLYLLILFTVIFNGYIAKILAKLSILSIYLIVLGVFVFLSCFFYFFITRAFKLNTKEHKKSDTSDKNQKNKFAANFTTMDKLFFVIYMILLIVVVIGLNFIIKAPDINPGNKMSYEVIQNEKNFNVVIGYKDGRAITLTGVESIHEGNSVLRFINNEYILQNIEEKVIVYKRYSKVVPYEDTAR